MIDTHCHLNDDMLVGEIDSLVNNFLSAGVDKAICVGCDNNSNYKAKEIAAKCNCVYYAVGIHPDEVDEYDETKLRALLDAKDTKLVAIGEIGLDYYTRNGGSKDKEKQKQVFISQLKLANEYNLPVIIHCRDAYGDTLEILKGIKLNRGFVFHCYSGSLEFASEIMKLGGKISFTGSVTFKNAKNVQMVAKSIPDNSFFFETDSPYLSPEPFRGKRNEPKNVAEVLKFVAKLREIDEKMLEKMTDETAKKFFDIT